MDGLSFRFFRRRLVKNEHRIRMPKFIFVLWLLTHIDKEIWLQSPSLSPSNSQLHSSSSSFPSPLSPFNPSPFLFFHHNPLSPFNAVHICISVGPSSGVQTTRQCPCPWKKNNFSMLSSHYLPIAPQLGAEFYLFLPQSLLEFWRLHLVQVLRGINCSFYFFKFFLR